MRLLVETAAPQSPEVAMRAYNVALQTYETELQLLETLEQERAAALSAIQHEAHKNVQMLQESDKGMIEQERLVELAGGSDEEKARRLKSVAESAEERRKMIRDNYEQRVAPYSKLLADVKMRIEEQLARVERAQRLRDQVAQDLPMHTDK